MEKIRRSDNMVKIFVTGDNHIGKTYSKYPEVKDILIQSRFDSLRNMVIKAEEVGCGLFIITGDLFDNTFKIKVSDVKKVVDILSMFSGDVIVLPGNHDYYAGDEKVWKDFEKSLLNVDHNITLIKEFKTYNFEVGEEKVVIYPAFCQSKLSETNNLDWIKNSKIQESGVINIGIAHGALQGVTPDIKEEYFLMSEAELVGIPVDIWLLGHTHIPYPNVLKEDEDTIGYKVFNAGTHEQTDISNNTEGNGFIITIEKNGNISKIMARKFVSGHVRYFDIKLAVNPNSDDALAKALNEAISGIDDYSIVKITISGSVKHEEYMNKENIYKECLGRFLTYKKNDNELSEEITVDKIRDEFAETSFAAKFMEGLITNPTELQMAYQLIQECKE